MDRPGVLVDNIGLETTEGQVKDFFSFCGKISSLELEKGSTSQKAKVTFEKETAAKTALLLDNTQLGSNVVNVHKAFEEVPEKGPVSTGGVSTEHSGDEIEQEDKPRSRIIAEYLANGYAMSDKTIERAIALDNQHGFSQRFRLALSSFDSKYKATERAQGLDKQYGVTEKAGAGLRGMHSYFERAMGTTTGQKIRTFYVDTQKQVMDVHNEARRLADLKGGKSASHPTAAPETEKPAEYPGSASTAGASDIEKMHLEKVEGTQDRTKCTCGGSDGVCPCEPGKCMCAGCGKNPDAKS